MDAKIILKISEKNKLKIYGNNKKQDSNYFYCIEINIDKFNQLYIVTYDPDGSATNQSMIKSDKLLGILTAATRQESTSALTASTFTDGSVKEEINIQQFINDNNNFITFTKTNEGTSANTGAGESINNEYHIKFEEETKTNTKTLLLNPPLFIKKSRAIIDLQNNGYLYFVDKNTADAPPAADKTKIYKIKIRCTRYKPKKIKRNRVPIEATPSQITIKECYQVQNTEDEGDEYISSPYEVKTYQDLIDILNGYSYEAERNIFLIKAKKDLGDKLIAVELDENHLIQCSMKPKPST